MEHTLLLTAEEFAAVVEMRRQRNATTRTRSPLVFGYVRCSNPESKKTGLSPLEQREQIEAWRSFLIQENPSLQRGEIFEDLGESAITKTLLSRKDGKRLLLALQPGDHVVFARLDRGFRNARDQLNQMHAWDRRGIIFHSTDLRLDTSNAGGRMVVGLIAVMNQYEGDKITEKNRAIAEAKRRQTKCPHLPSGKRPVIGYVKKGPKRRRYLVPREDQREWMDWIIEMRDGGLSFRDIAYICEERVRQLAEAGEPQKPWRDRAWDKQTVHRWYKRGKEQANGAAQEG